MLIGLDGGATKFAAREVILAKDDDGSGPWLWPGFDQAEHRVPKWTNPVSLAQQLKERESPSMTPQEVAAGDKYIDAAVRAIASVAEGSALINLGVCMPGLKTPDRRGICVMRNGPRMPYFCAQLEEALQRLRIFVTKRIPFLIGDGEACGLGERLGKDGKFRDVKWAYYIGGGTGVAEAALIDGEVKTLDSIGMPRAWEIQTADGRTFEDWVSQNGIKTRYEMFSQKKIQSPKEFEKIAIAKDPIAIHVLKSTASATGNLIRERYLAFKYERKTPLQRVVLGQHTGRLFNDPHFAESFREPLLEYLKRIRVECEVLGSNMREAPVLGAASTAL